MMAACVSWRSARRDFIVMAGTIAAGTLTLGCASLARGKPLIAAFGDYNVTEPVGGQGLSKSGSA